MQVYIPTEEAFRALLKEVVLQCMQEYFEASNQVKIDPGEPLLSREDIAKRLDISLVTLNDWKNRGLPFHKQRGRVYYLYSEVMIYIRANNLEKRLSPPFRI